jgi:hypothetical protein
MQAGNLVGGLAYSHFQNFETTYYYQTKLRILIVYEKREVLGLSFLVGCVHKLRRAKIKFETLIITRFFLPHVIFGHTLLGSLNLGPPSFHTQ